MSTSNEHVEEDPQPQIGIIPKWLHAGHHLADLQAAIERYRVVGLAVDEVQQCKDEVEELTRYLQLVRSKLYNTPAEQQTTRIVVEVEADLEEFERHLLCGESLFDLKVIRIVHTRRPNCRSIIDDWLATAKLTSSFLKSHFQSSSK